MTDTAAETATILAAARAGARLASLPEALRPADMAAAYKVQAKTLEGVAIGGWKVGLFAGGKAFFCAPMRASGVVASPANLGPGLYRGTESEVAFRVGRDLPPGKTYSREEVIAALPTAHPILEILESAFVDPDLVDPLSNLADCFLHGGFVYGPGRQDWHGLDFPNITVSQHIDDAEMQRTGNPAGDMIRLVEFLANEGTHWAGGLKTGQFVTCGSWTGKTRAPAGAKISANFPGLGEARAKFAAS